MPNSTTSQEKLCSHHHQTVDALAKASYRLAAVATNTVSERLAELSDAFLLLICVQALLLASMSSSCNAEDPVGFRQDIVPILLENCVACHGPKRSEGGYRLDSFARLKTPGDSGIPPLDQHKETASVELLRRLCTSDEDERMPVGLAPLTNEQIKKFRAWLADGAPFDGQDENALIHTYAPYPEYKSPDKYATTTPITALAYDYRSGLTIAGGYHELLLWNLNRRELKRRISDLPERIFSLDWSGDQRFLAVAGGSPGRSGEVRIVHWESKRVERSRTLGMSQDVVRAVAFQPQGKLLASGHSDGTIRWFDAFTSEQLGSIAAHADAITAIAWSRDGKLLATASRDKTAKVFDMQTGDLITTYASHNDQAVGIAFTDDGKHLLSVDADKKYHRWQSDDAKRAARIELTAVPNRLVLRNGLAFISFSNGAIQQIDVAKDRIVNTLNTQSSITSLCVVAIDDSQPSSNLSHLLTGTSTGQVQEWPLSPGAPVPALKALPSE